MKLSRNAQMLLFSSIAAAAAALLVSDSRMGRKSQKLIEKTAGEAAEKWKKRLSLTNEQTSRLKDKLKEFGGKKDDLMNARMKSAVRKERLIRLQEMEERELKIIFTPAQYEMFIYLVRKG